MKYLIYKNSSVNPPKKYKIIGEEQDFYVVEGSITPFLKIQKDMCEVFDESEEVKCDGLDCAWCAEINCPRAENKGKEG